MGLTQLLGTGLESDVQEPCLGSSARQLPAVREQHQVPAGPAHAGRTAPATASGAENTR